MFGISEEELIKERWSFPGAAPPGASQMSTSAVRRRRSGRRSWRRSVAPERPTRPPSPGSSSPRGRNWIVMSVRQNDPPVVPVVGAPEHYAGAVSMLNDQTTPWVVEGRSGHPRLLAHSVRLQRQEEVRSDRLRRAPARPRPSPRDAVSMAVARMFLGPGAARARLCRTGPEVSASSIRKQRLPPGPGSRW